MNNCRVSKLKVSFSNPNLPKFIDVKDYADYINAAHNQSMTEIQQYQMAKFFSSLGALENSALWGKIKVLCIPFVAGSKDYIYVNYKTPATPPITPASSTFFVDKGVVSQNGDYHNDGESIGTVNFTNVTILGMPTTNKGNGINYSYVGALKQTSAKFYVVFTDEVRLLYDDAQYDLFSGKYTGYGDSWKGKAMGVTLKDGKGYYITNHGVTMVGANSLPSYLVSSAETWLSYFANIGQMQFQENSSPGGFVMIADAFTDAETLKVSKAVEELASYFI